MGPAVGGMGFHYLNVARIIDPAISLTEPEVLLYAPTEQGDRLFAYHPCNKAAGAS